MYEFFNKYYYNIYSLIAISIFLRLLLISFYGDANLENEWGVLFNNLYFNNILSYRSFDNQLIPNLYMPPLYAYIIFCIKILIQNNYDLVKSIIICQIIFSGITIYFFYKLSLYFLSKKMSVFSSFLFAFFPLFAYASIQISSITFQVFLNIVFLYLILKLINNDKIITVNFFLGVVSGFLILLRGEFIVIFLATIIYLFFFKKLKIKQFFIIVLTSLIILSPYLIRNYIVFEKTTITKSFGFNLWKGNNPESKVEGSTTHKAFSEGDLLIQIKNLPKDKYYDINYDQIFLKKAISFIIEEPILFIQRYFKKFLSFAFFNLDSDYPKYNDLLNILPLVILSILFVFSVFFTYQKNSIGYNYLLFNMVITLGLFSIFFILPRYKLIIIPIQIIIISIFISNLIKKFNWFEKKKK